MKSVTSCWTMSTLTEVCLVLALVGSVDGESCSNSCSWLPWNAWSACSQTCGGGTRYRTRPICCPSSVLPQGFDACTAHCGKSSDDGSEREACSTVCSHGTYDGARCQCQGGYYGACCTHQICCGDPGPLLNGQVEGGDFCHGGLLTYSCNTHYNLTGSYQRRCAERWYGSGYWTGSGPACVYVNTCGSQPCQNGGSCVDGLNQFTCVCVRGWSGTLCEIDVLPPAVSGCPDDVIYRTAEKKLSITWSVPEFRDDHGEVVDVTSNFPTNNNTLPWGEYTVQYVATKRTNGLRTTCTFSVSVYPFPCHSIPPLDVGAFACNGWNGRYTEVCALLCPSDRDVGLGEDIRELYVCGGRGEWVPRPPTTGCSEKRSSIDAVNGVMPGSGHHYYEGATCRHDAATQAQIRRNYLTIIRQSDFREICERWEAECTPNNVTVIC